MNTLPQPNREPRPQSVGQAVGQFWDEELSARIATVFGDDPERRQQAEATLKTLTATLPVWIDTMLARGETERVSQAGFDGRRPLGVLAEVMQAMAAEGIALPPAVFADKFIAVSIVATNAADASAEVGTYEDREHGGTPDNDYFVRRTIWQPEASE